MTLAVLRADPGRGRPPSVVAPGHRGARRRLGALLGVRRAVSSPTRPSPPRAPPTWWSTRYVRCRPTSRTTRSSPSEISHDRFRDTPGDQLLTGLRGKDVLLAFVESYGKVAVQGSSFSPQVYAVLDKGTRRLQAAGFSARSAFLDLADLWRHQLAGALHHAVGPLGRQPAALRPARQDRPLHAQRRVQAGRVADRRCRAIERPGVVRGVSFYHFDKVYDRRDVGYHGPRFAYASMPDQYVLSALQRLELAKTPPPPPLRGARLGLEPHAVDPHPPADPLARRGRRLDLQQHSGGQHDQARALERLLSAYARRTAGPSSTRWARWSRSCSATADPISCSSSWATISPPRSSPGSARVTTCRSRLLPTTRRCWTGSPGGAGDDGLRPGPQAPVWPMSAFRDRFLSAFDSRGRDGR